MTNYTRKSNEELRENGFLPLGLDGDVDDDGGPFFPYQDKEGLCGCCGGQTTSWTVVDVSEAFGIGEYWSHDGADVEAHERANVLNNAWLRGYRAGTGT